MHCSKQMFVRVSLDIYFCITFFSTDLTHKTSKRQSNTLITKGKDISNPEDIANAFIFFFINKALCLSNAILSSKKISLKLFTKLIST